MMIIKFATSLFKEVLHQLHLAVDTFIHTGRYLLLFGMCPQLSLQVMMGTGTPMAVHVKVTVCPRAAVMDSSGGLVTVGAAKP